MEPMRRSTGGASVRRQTLVRKGQSAGLLARAKRALGGGLAGAIHLVLLGSLAAASVAEAQYGPSINEQTGRERAKRVDKATLAAWVEHLADPRPGVRMWAVKALAGSGDPKAIPHLVEAALDHDPRIAARAIDFLGRLRVIEAAEFLAERLFVKNTSDPLRLQILVALGRIGDSRTTGRILDFVDVAANAELKAAAVFALGEAGDATIVEDLRRLAADQSDPSIRKVANYAIEKISGRRDTPTPLPENPLLRSVEP